MSKLICLDCDGVMLDYNLAYARLWERAYGAFPEEINPSGYSVMDQYKIQRLRGFDLDHFMQFYRSSDFWSTMPALPNAVKACNDLVDRGYEIVVVSAIEATYEKERMKNLLDLGFPVSDLFATGSSIIAGKSPKANVIDTLTPDFFVDDYGLYFDGISSPNTKNVLINRSPECSPNQFFTKCWDYEFSSLYDFTSSPIAH